MTGISRRLSGKTILFAMMLISICWGIACDDNARGNASNGTSPYAPGTPSTEPRGDGHGGAPNDASGVTDAGQPGDSGPSTSDDTSEGPQPAAPKTYSGGQCPGLVAGANSIETAGTYRQLEIFMPSEPEGAGVVFLWHGFGDTPSNFGGSMGAANVAATKNVIVVVPAPDYVPAPGLPTTWRLLGDPGPDLTLFDDLLSCLDGQYDIDNKRVYTTGFSAGALWSSLLVIQRAEYLASATLWSGGTGAGGLVQIDYQTPGYDMPVLTAWGGDNDLWGSAPIGVDFAAASQDLADELQADGHAVVRCNHGGGHTIPSGGVTWGWRFLLDHTFGAGPSPYMDYTGSDFPGYCTFPTSSR